MCAVGQVVHEPAADLRVEAVDRAEVTGHFGRTLHKAGRVLTDHSRVIRHCHCKTQHGHVIITLYGPGDGD